MADKIVWSPEQERAITFRDRGAIVSAAAGSGKTTVLVERVMRLLTDKNNPVNADEMVISTFTNEAAGKLKESLTKALDKLIEEDPSDDHLVDQRIRLNDAYISTIDSFCLGVLRRNSAAAGLQPGFRIIDTSEAGLIRENAMNAVMEEFCAHGGQDRDLLFDRFAESSDRKIVSAVGILYNFYRKLPDGDKFFDVQLDLYRDPEGASGYFADLAKKQFGKKVLGSIGSLGEMCAELRELTENTVRKTYTEHCAAWNELYESVAGITDLSSCKTAYEAVKSASPPTSPRKPTGKNVLDSDEKFNTVIKALHERLKSEWEQLVLYMGLFSRREDDMKACYPVLRALTGLMKRLDEEYSARKRELNCVDFEDLELMALRLLRNEENEPSDIAKEIAKTVKIIIVDEFQDSNDIQYDLFRLISDNKKNLFFVGDIKQSIYGFRGADPLVFSDITRSPDFEVIALNRNFRSCGQVIDSVNAIFTGTMTEELGDVQYDASCALVRGAAYDTDDDINRTELLTFRAGSAPESRRKEAAYIAARINDMIVHGFPVTENGKKRPCRYGDFAVLMGRYSSNIPLYKEAFDKAGIPYDARATEEYTDFSEIKHAISLLKVIDDPYRDSDLAAVLMHAPYLLGEKDMAEIKLLAGRGRRLWTGLLRYAKTDSRAGAIVAELKGFRSFAEENSAERLLRRICDESRLIPAAEASPGGTKRVVNLRKLIHFAESFSGGESASLCDFIKYMDSIRNSNVKIDAPKSGSVGQVVRFMTIHGSKGLEFPVCFVSNLSSRASHESADIVCNSRFGIGMKRFDSENMLKIDTQPYKMVHDELLRLERSEEMRLLYVAATRAREKLIFTAPLSSDNTDMHYSWIDKSEAVRSKLIFKAEDPAPPADIRNDSMSGEKAGLADIPPFTAYKYGTVSGVPAKVTATQIGVKSVDDYAETTEKIERFLRIPSFLGTGETAKLTGKKRGDAYHKVMEHLDFGAKETDIPRILDELCDNGKLSEIERVSVSEEDIAAFLRSDICRRADASGNVKREFPIFCEYVPKPGEWGITDWSEEEKPFMQGIADMFFIEDGEIVLVDYKTNKNTTAEALTEEYRGQLEIYAGALSEATGMRVKQKLLYSFELGEIEIA